MRQRCALVFVFVVLSLHSSVISVFGTIGPTTETCDIVAFHVFQCFLRCNGLRFLHSGMHFRTKVVASSLFASNASVTRGWLQAVISPERALRDNVSP